MEPPERQRIKGSIIHAWGSFRVRAPTIVRTEGYPDVPMTWYPVTIMLSADDEHTIGTLSSTNVSLPGLVAELRNKLRTLEHTIKTWTQHLREYQQPERMAGLQAQLDAEGSSLSAAEVLENQREERRRVQALYAAIQVGLHELEEEFPEL